MKVRQICLMISRDCRPHLYHPLFSRTYPADRISKAYGIACQEYIRKEEELKDLEEGIPEEKLKAMERESEARGTEQFASPESKRTYNLKHYE